MWVDQRRWVVGFKVSVSTSPTHASAGLNVTSPSRPKPQAANPCLRRPQRHQPKLMVEVVVVGVVDVGLVAMVVE